VKEGFERCFDDTAGQILSVIVKCPDPGIYSFPGWLDGAHGNFGTSDGRMYFAVDTDNFFIESLSFSFPSPTDEFSKSWFALISVLPHETSGFPSARFTISKAIVRTSIAKTAVVGAARFSIAPDPSNVLGSCEINDSIRMDSSWVVLETNGFRFSQYGSGTDRVSDSESRPSALLRPTVWYATRLFPSARSLSPRFSISHYDSGTEGGDTSQSHLSRFPGVTVLHESGLLSSARMKISDAVGKTPRFEAPRSSFTPDRSRELPLSHIIGSVGNGVSEDVAKTAHSFGSSQNVSESERQEASECIEFCSSGRVNSIPVDISRKMLKTTRFASSQYDPGTEKHEASECVEFCSSGRVNSISADIARELLRTTQFASSQYDSGTDGFGESGYGRSAWPRPTVRPSVLGGFPVLPVRRNRVRFVD
jgi:hypothetical protein